MCQCIILETEKNDLSGARGVTHGVGVGVRAEPTTPPSLGNFNGVGVVLEPGVPMLPGRRGALERFIFS